MRVTFDSNVWEKIVLPEFEQKDYAYLKELISNGDIEPYICEIALSLESVIKKNRWDFASSYQPKFEIHSETFTGNKYLANIFLGPNNDKHPGLHPILLKKLRLAERMGFKVLIMTNYGIARSAQILDWMKITFSEIEFMKYAERLAECSNFISSKGWGFAKYEVFKDKYGLHGGPYNLLSKAISDKIRHLS